MREVARTIEIFTMAGEEARRIAATGEVVPIDAVPRGEGRIGLTKRFPLGTVLGITAFNAPILLPAHKIAPALAAGCPCIVRPAPKTPLSALSLGEIVLEAGAPPGAVTVIPSSNELAERMVRDERVKMLTFTGSARVGWYLKGIAATPHVTLELGGNGAVIVHEDADLDHAAARCAFGGFLRAGQACISVQRLYAHSSVVDAFQEKLLERITELETGNPLDESTALGGLIDETAAEKTMALIEESQGRRRARPLRRHARRNRRRADAPRRRAGGAARLRRGGVRPDHRALCLRRRRRGDRARERHALRAPRRPLRA